MATSSAVEKRDAFLGVRLSKTELAMLRQLANDDGISPSDVIRQLVRRTHRQRFGASTKGRK